MRTSGRVPKQFLGAFKAGHRLPVREYIDDELSWILLNKIEESNWQDKESIKQLEYITKFNNEYYKKFGLKEDDALHNTPELKKDCYDRGNSIDRDMLSMKRRERTHELSTQSQNTEHNQQFINLNHEDALIDLIDLSNN